MGTCPLSLRLSDLSLSRLPFDQCFKIRAPKKSKRMIRLSRLIWSTLHWGKSVALSLKQVDPQIIRQLDRARRLRTVSLLCRWHLTKNRKCYFCQWVPAKKIRGQNWLLSLFLSCHLMRNPSAIWKKFPCSVFWMWLDIFYYRQNLKNLAR